MPARTPVKESSLLTPERVAMLKETGHLRMEEGVQTVPGKVIDLLKLEFVYNPTDSLILVPDLELSVYGHDIVYLPQAVRDYSPEKVKKSGNLRTALYTMKCLVPIEDPAKELTEEQVTAPLSAFDRITPEVEHIADQVLGAPNAYQEALAKEGEKEEALNKAAQSGGLRRKPGATRGGQRG